MSVDLSEVEKHVSGCLTRVYDEVAKTPDRIPTTIAIGLYAYDRSVTFYVNYDDDQGFHCEALEDFRGGALAGFLIPDMEAWAVEGEPLRFVGADSGDEGEGAYEALFGYVAAAAKRWIEALPPSSWRPNRLMFEESPVLFLTETWELSGWGQIATGA